MKIDHPSPAHLPALRALWQEAFGDSESYLNSFFSLAYHPMRCLCLEVDGQIAAAAYWLDCQIEQQKAAYIYAVATAETSRGKGYCRALMDAIHKSLAGQGYCGSILVPGDDTLRIMYRKMGYCDFGGIQEFTCTPSGTAATMTKISSDAFAALRRQYLPEYAVIQEDENLMLLDALAEFYQGDDFLLTVSRNEDGIRVSELLGNHATAANIAKFFGGATCFRTPGNQPFAMYRPILKSKFPSYFAFAFD